MPAVVSFAQRINGRRFRARFVHSEWATVQKRAVQGTNCVLGLLGIRHLDEGETAWLPGVTVEHDHGRLDVAKDAESSAKLLFGHSKAHVTNEDINHRIALEAYRGDHRWPPPS